MALYGVQFTLTYTAWDTVANAGKTGDVANHSLRWIKDGVDAAATNAPAEVSAANAPGEYKVVITAAEAQCLIGKLAGKSSTANISIIPQQVTFERLPNVALGAAGGLPLADANGDVGISQTAADKVWASAARTLTSFGTLVADIWANVSRTLTDKTGFSLTAGERTAIANEVEAQIIDETDSEKVLTAITDKIAAVNPSLSGLTLAAIATAVRDKTLAGSAAGSVGEALLLIAQIKAKTDNLTGDPADASDIAALLAELDGAVADLQTAVNAVPTAVQNADALLDRNMATGVDSGTEVNRTVRQALRANRNRVDLATGKVYKEDDATTSHNFAVTTDPAAEPITAINPTGGG